MGEVLVARSLREQVLQSVRAAVITGEMKPGELYSAPAIAQRLGVSATPVREAMVELAQQGLVVAVRNKGFRVTEVSDKDLDELTELRQVLESHGVRCAVPFVTAMDIAQLRTVADTIVSEARRENLIGYIGSDEQFHTQLLNLAGNDRLVRVVLDLRAQTRLFGLHALARQGELVDSALEHHAILDLVEQGRADEAAEFIRRHVSNVRGKWASSVE